MFKCSGVLSGEGGADSLCRFFVPVNQKTGNCVLTVLKNAFSQKSQLL